VEIDAFDGSLSDARLLNKVIERAKADASLDEVGCLVPSQERTLYRACVGEGFRLIGAYWVYARELTGG